MLHPRVLLKVLNREFDLKVLAKYIDCPDLPFEERKEIEKVMENSQAATLEHF